MAAGFLNFKISSFHNLLNANPPPFHLFNVCPVLSHQQNRISRLPTFFTFSKSAPSFMSPTKPAPPLLPPLARILISTLASSHTMQQLVEIIPIKLLLLLSKPHNAARPRDHPHRPLAQRDDEQDEETMNVPTN